MYERFGIDVTVKGLDHGMAESMKRGALIGFGHAMMMMFSL